MSSLRLTIGVSESGSCFIKSYEEFSCSSSLISESVDNLGKVNVVSLIFYLIIFSIHYMRFNGISKL